jgi:predicted RNA-binding Zn-ribbon protein involved in translation (DUF1610 family)
MARRTSKDKQPHHHGAVFDWTHVEEISCPKCGSHYLRMILSCPKHKFWLECKCGYTARYVAPEAEATAFVGKYGPDWLAGNV